jgi:hypothetical protein
MHTILQYKIIIFTYEGQAKNTMLDIEWKYLPKISFLSVLHLSLNFCKNLVFFLVSVVNEAHVRWSFLENVCEA